jgi:hypothetical protein
MVSCKDYAQFGTMLMLYIYVKVVHNLFSHGWFL